MLFPIITLVCFALADFASVFAARREKPMIILFWELLLACLVFSLYLPFNSFQFNLEMLVLTVVLGIFELLGSLFFLKSLKRGNASISGTVSGSYTALVIILALLIFGEKLMLKEIIGIILAFLGFLLVSFRGKIRLENFYHDRGIVFALLAAIFWAVNAVFLKIPVSRIGWFMPVFLYTFNWILLAGYFFFKKQKFWPEKKHSLGIIFLAGIFLSTGLLSYNLGISKNYISLNAAIVACYPILYVLLCWVFLKEKMSTRQRIGVLLGLIGIATLNI